MGKQWDNSGIAYKVELWKECLRVLKPGGHLLAFGATRSYHRMAVAIEDAGFEIRDSIHWTYGSGFPKSLDVSKAIEGKLTTGSSNKKGFKNLNGEKVERGNWGIAKQQFDHGQRDTNYDETAGDTRLGKLNATTDQAKEWAGWGTALKPSHEPIVVARKPLVGTVASNVLEYGTGGLNIDGTRVGTGDGSVKTVNYPDIRGNNYNNAKGTVEYTVESQGRFPANTVLTHAAGCEATGESISDETSAGNRTATFGKEEKVSGGEKKDGWKGQVVSTPVYKCVLGCPIPELDGQSGVSKSTDNKWEGENNAPIYGKYNKGIRQSTYSDKGGASRFFTQTNWTQWDDLTPFLYIPKPSKKERNKGLEEVEAKSTGIKGHGLGRICATCGTKQMTGCKCPDATYINPPANNFHPTVKPVELMRHLCRLVTPPNGTVLDPFTGSGSTGVAAILENFQFVGIELTAEYLPIIDARLKQAEKEYKETQPTLPLEETE